MCKNIFFSSKAYFSLVNEVYSYLNIETGGILMGQIVNDDWYIIEVIDPGYRNIIRSYSYFEYDRDYVTHQANIISEKYEQNLSLLGLWHRHPGSMDTFSLTDDGTNKDFALLNHNGAISGLVNLDPDFRLTMYHIKSTSSVFKFLQKPRYTKITNIFYGDEYIPKNLLKMKDADDILNNIEGHLIEEKDSIYTKDTIYVDSDIENKLFDTLDLELDYLEKQKDYQYEISPIDTEDSSIVLKLSYLGNFTNYAKNINCKIYIDEDNLVNFIIVANNINSIKGKYKQNLIKKFIDKYIASSSNQNFDSEYQKNIDYVNYYLKKAELNNLELKGRNFEKKELKIIQKELLKIIHPDMAAVDEDELSKYNSKNITQSINEAIDYLIKGL